MDSSASASPANPAGATQVRATVARLSQRRGEYGVDAPYAPITLGASGVVLLIAAAVSFWVFQFTAVAIICLAYAVFMLASTACYVYTTRSGKIQVWAETLARLGLRGDERVLDL